MSLRLACLNGVLSLNVPIYLLTRLGVIAGRLAVPIPPVHSTPVQTKVVLCCGFEDGLPCPFRTMG
jgi:hypothetical protein